MEQTKGGTVTYHMKATTPEGAVKRAVTNYLTLRKHFWISVSTTGTYDPRTGAYRTSPYSHRGMSDMIVFPKGRLEPIFVELKAKAGKLSPDQILFREHVTSLGFEYAVVRSVDDCIGLGL